MKVKYFAWVRERIGKAEETVEPPADVRTVGELIGCLLVDIASGSPSPVGVIEDVDRDAGPVALLVVKSDASVEEILVPFAKAYLRQIDLEGRRVDMALPEGLVDVQFAGKPGGPVDAL